MIDEQIVDKIKNTEYCDIEEIFADFPNVAQDKILFHVKKNMPQLLNNDGQSSDISFNGSKKKMKKSELIEWCKMHPLITLNELYTEFKSSKPATLRAYRNEALNELIPVFTDFFMSNITIDHFKAKKEIVRELIQYVVIRPRVQDYYLKKNFPDVNIVELKNLQKIILDELKKYVGDDDSINNTNTSDHKNTNILDHASSLSLNELKNKVAGHQTAQKKSLNETDMKLSSEIDQLNQQIQAMQSNFEEFVSISGDILDKIKNLENIITEKFQLKDDGVERNFDASTHLIQQVLSGMDNNNAGVIGALIGGILRGTGSVNIDFGKK